MFGWGNPFQQGFGQSPFGQPGLQFQYNTGVTSTPQFSPQAGMSALQGLGGRTGPNWGSSPTQQAELSRLSQDITSGAGNQAALDFSNIVNRGESGLRAQQDSLKSQVGLGQQQFANRRYAHNLNQQRAMQDMRFGLLSELLGGFI